MRFWNLAQTLVTSVFRLKVLAKDPAPQTVPTNTVSIYAKSKAGISTLYYEDDAGFVHDLSSGDGSGSGGDPFTQYLVLAGRGSPGQSVKERVTFTGLTPVYNLLGGGHATQLHIDLGATLSPSVNHAIDGLLVEGRLATNTNGTDQRNLTGIYVKMDDQDNGTGDHRVRGILIQASTGATFGTSNHKVTALEGTAVATGISDADIHGIEGHVTPVATTPATSAVAVFAGQDGFAGVATGFALGATDWLYGVDLASFPTSISGAGIVLKNAATMGKILWNDANATYLRAGVTSALMETSATTLQLGGSGIFRGGTASGGNINFESTSHPTKGNVQVSGKWSIVEATGVMNLVPTTTSGAGYAHTQTQTSPNASDTSDAAISLGYTLSAASATNELVNRTFTLALTNTLTGGGHLQNARLMDVSHVVSAGAVTDSASLLYSPGNTVTGTLTSFFGMNLAGAPGGATNIGLSFGGWANTDFFLQWPADNTDPTGGGGAATGRIAIKIAGATKYIPYY